MTIYDLAEFRRLRDRYRDSGVAIELARLSDGEVADLAANAEWAVHCARLVYDAQARHLRRYGIDPAPIIGDRP